MNLTTQLAKHLREVHSGGNWTWSDFKGQLADMTWQQATAKTGSLNTIATLVYHMNYYLNSVAGALAGKGRSAVHELSFVHPPIASQQDWQQLVDKTFADAESFAGLIEQMPEEKLWETLSEKHGLFYTNIQGVIEHSYYHLGQIAIIKKMLVEKERGQ